MSCNNDGFSSNNLLAAHMDLATVTRFEGTMYE